MKAVWKRVARVAPALALLLGLGACGPRPAQQMDHPSVEINRQSEPGATPVQQSQAPAAPQTTVMGAGSSQPAIGEDQRIVAEVQAALRSDAELAPMGIEVRSEDGLVSLHGRAPDGAARDRAGDLARTVGGVKSVDNMLTLG
jgi:osmotically-inducible protein OsmY